MTNHKQKSHSNMMLLLVAAFVIVAGVYFWRKKAAQPNCKEICFSTSPENGEGCDVICVPPADAPAA